MDSCSHRRVGLVRQRLRVPLTCLFVLTTGVVHGTDAILRSRAEFLFVELQGESARAVELGQCGLIAPLTPGDAAEPEGRECTGAWPALLERRFICGDRGLQVAGQLGALALFEELVGSDALGERRLRTRWRSQRSARLARQWYATRYCTSPRYAE